MKRALFLLLFALTVLLFLWIGNPYSDSWMLKCPLHTLTGYQCPLCGMQRQIHSLMKLDFKQAWEMNQGLLLSYPYLAMLFLADIFPSLRASRVGAFCLSNPVLLTFIGLMIVWGIVRNVI